MLATADLSPDEPMSRDDVLRALAMWLVLLKQQEHIEATFDKYDADGTGSLSRAEVRQCLSLSSVCPSRSTG
eukprot:SAG22_NODE_178_length_16142_cov_13.187995_15_plen_72_part_00